MVAIGSSLATYIQTVAASERAAATGTKASASDAVLLTSMQRKLKAVAKQLAAIRPPGDVATAHSLLARGVTEYASELGAVISKLRSGTAPAEALADIPTLKGVTDMEAASKAITAKGYAISG